MIADIEDGSIGVVICKDLSRLGRNNALVAYYTELFFIENNIRFIALNDGIDTLNGDNEIMPFKSVINEFYARDLSKKVRSALRAHSLNGEHHASKPPYGYLQNPIDKHKLIIDEEAGSVVCKIFRMAEEGLSPQNIATRLYKSGVLSPAALYYQRTGHIHARYDTSQTCKWSQMTVRRILTNQTYLGHMVNHRQTTKSFKNRSKISVPETDWIIVKNTHPNLIDEDTFERVQKLISIKYRENKRCLDNIFAGMVFCSDCGKRLNYMSGGHHKGGKGGYECGSYRRSCLIGMEKKCSPHRIGFVPLYNAVLQHLHVTMAEMLNPEDLIIKLGVSAQIDNVELTKNFEKFKRRANELMLLIKSIIEQNAIGILDSGIAADLLTGYQNEYKTVLVNIEEIKCKLSNADVKNTDNQILDEHSKKYFEIKELNREIILDLIDKLIIYEPKTTCGKRTYRIDIHYRFIRSVPVCFAL